MEACSGTGKPANSRRCRLSSFSGFSLHGHGRDQNSIGLPDNATPFRRTLAIPDITVCVAPAYFFQQAAEVS